MDTGSRVPSVEEVESEGGPAPGGDDRARAFRGQPVLITGGLGFIGSNLAIRLAGAGADVRIVDSMLPDHGANPFNIAPVAGRVAVEHGDLRDADAMRRAVRGQAFVFHLAGRSDHVASLEDPLPDIDVNIRGSAILLDACRRESPRARLVYAGTRGEYGPAARLPVAEDAPLQPRGVYELTSLAAQKLFQIYRDSHGLECLSLRLTNIYGPRAQMRHDRSGVVNWFIRKALDSETIPVFGDGSIRRDILYVDDAVEAILACATTEAAWGGVFNVGEGRATTLRELADAIVEAAGAGRVELRPFSRERAKVEPGDFCADIERIRRVTGWAPRVPLRDGLARTVGYYREHRARYWP